MKKILLTYNGKEFSNGIFEFARQLNSRQPVFITGVFIPELVYANLWVTGDIPIPTYFPVSDEADEDVQAAMNQFEASCRQHNIAHRLHKDYADLPQAELLEESRFADVLVISSEKFYQSFAKEELNPNLRDLLHTAECPVIVVPEQFQFPNKNILFYDGSASSVFAIKQFAYLFPELCDNETLIIYSSTDADKRLPHETYIEELATQHFKNLTFSKLHSAKNEIPGRISQEEGVILVGGAFGRSGFSETLRKSYMQDLINLHKYPVFIAHR